MDQNALKAFEAVTAEKIKTLLVELEAKATEFQIAPADKNRLLIWTLLSLAADLANSTGLARPDALKMLGDFFDFHLKRSMEKHKVT